MRSSSFQTETTQELRDHLQAQINEGFQPSLALVFCSTQQKPAEVSRVFSEFDIAVYGCTTAGEICNEEVYSDSIVTLLMDMKPDYFNLFFRETTATQSTYQNAFDLGTKARERFDNPAIIVLSSGLGIDAEQIVFGIKDGVGREVPIFGGLAGDDLQLKETLVFCNQEQSDNGFACMVVDNDKISVRGMATSGWEAIGTEHTITKAKGNVIYTINNEPALDVFIKYFGFFDNINGTAAEAVSTLSAQYPLQIQKEGGYSILRSPMLANPDDKSLVLFGGVQEGDRFRFSISPGFEVIDQTIREFGVLRDESQEADALILFSCKGRHAALGPLLENETKGIYEYWNKPMIGFLSYGEIGNTRSGQCEFHNETCSLVIFKEK